MYVVANRRCGMILIEVVLTQTGYHVRSNGNHVATFFSRASACRRMESLAGPNATGNDFYDA